jgi:hypothetical protein
MASEIRTSSTPSLPSEPRISHFRTSFRFWFSEITFCSNDYQKSCGNTKSCLKVKAVRKIGCYEKHFYGWLVRAFLVSIWSLILTHTFMVLTVREIPPQLQCLNCFYKLHIKTKYSKLCDNQPRSPLVNFKCSIKDGDFVDHLSVLCVSQEWLCSVWLVGWLVGWLPDWLVG